MCFKIEQSTANCRAQSSRCVVESEQCENGEYRIAEQCIDSSHDKKAEKLYRPQSADQVADLLN